MTQVPTFARVEGNSHGVGKVLSWGQRDCDVEYFHSPAGPRLHRTSVPSALVEAIELAPQTRAFCLERGTQTWWAGRIEGSVVSAQAMRAREDHYPVRFPNDHTALVPISNLYVRWTHPIDDPTEYLSARITDTPYFYEGRSQIVRHLAKQRAAFGGLTGLASSAIELLEHQVTTIRRVLGDPISRYLLADEVGLGKTIEAGILVRQHVIDQPDNARVLVVVPFHLAEQWNEELQRKFYLHDSEVVQVTTEEEFVNSALEPENFTMLVVDEAHRAALKAFDPAPQARRLYDLLRRFATQISRLLLLSGTPVLHQEDGFLAMLHLLDPNAYPLNDRERFRARVRDRQMIGQAKSDLTDDASPLFVEEALTQLANLCATDPRIASLSAEVKARISDDAADPARARSLRALRIHLTESYQLHRRLLRTARDDPRVRLYLPKRNGAVRLAYTDEARAEAFDFLETWRLRLAPTQSADAQAELFALWVRAALSHPSVLVRYIDARVIALRAGVQIELSEDEKRALGAPCAFKGEEELLSTRRVLIAAALGEDARALRLVEWLREARNTSKVILFVDDPIVARSAVEALNKHLGPSGARLYDSTQRSSMAFEQQGDHRLLVCDRTSEEGLNLQRFAATVVHYDLPIEPGRIEQRIGRVDRIEAKGRMRNVIFVSEVPYEKQWTDCVTDAIRVFSRSVAPLQYVLIDVMRRLRSELLIEGQAAFEIATKRMLDPNTGLDAELRRIRSQDALDSLETDPDGDTQFSTMLKSADEDADESGATAINSWVVKRLHFISRPEQSGVFRYVHDTRRPTLMTVLQTLQNFAHCVDSNPEARHRNSELPLESMTCERAIAERTGVGLLRVGHPFITGVEGLVRSDDRGTAFTCRRYHPGYRGEARIFFLFDFVIEADLRQAFQLTRSRGVSEEALRRRADEAFPVQYWSIWLDSDLKEVADPALLEILAEPYSKEPSRSGMHDLNVRLDRWAAVDAEFPTADWAGVCFRARQEAERLLRKQSDFLRSRATCAAYARMSGARAAQAFESRVPHLTGPTLEAEAELARLESESAEAVAIGIDEPSIRVDSAGAIFLSDLTALRP